jgi:5-formyltetrahydrofolate cyclo-ligase
MKNKIREKFLKLRKNNYFELNGNHKKFILKNIKNIIKKTNLKKIGFYYPVNFEINITPIISSLRSKSIKTYLPVVEKNNKMNFREWKKYDPLCVNRFGILEPDKKNQKGKPDLLIVPLVSFDHDRNRLGYGRGFYDRFLNQISNKRNILSVGVAFSFQQEKKIPFEKHDKKLDFIITEKKLFGL